MQIVHYNILVAFPCAQGIEVGAVLISWGLSKSAELGGNLINQVNIYIDYIVNAVLFFVKTTLTVSQLTLNSIGFILP